MRGMERARRTRERRLLFALGAAGPLVAIALLGLWRDPGLVPLAMRDVTASAQVSPLTGALSSLGAFLWFAVAALCAFTAGLQRLAGDDEVRRFLAASGALSAYLWFDDFFLLHETLGPLAGIPEKAMLALLALAFLAYLLRFRRQVMAAGNRLLPASLGLLGLSEAADLLLARALGDTHPWQIFVEDGLKWLGICAWTGFHLAYCRGVLAGRQGG